MSKIPVMEIFGPTIQGEGMVVGQKTMFVRTAGCDYSCAWCDSAFTWDGSGKDLIRQMDAAEIWNELTSLGGEGFSYVTISGGNPALLKNMSSLVHLLKEKNIKICLETQGSKWQDWFLDIHALTLSPKPPSSGMETDFQVLDKIVDRLAEEGAIQNGSLKIVIFDDIDYEYAKMVHKRYPALTFFLQVGNDDIVTENRQKLMVSLVDKYEWLVEKVMIDNEMKNVRVLPQLHVYIWGNKRGV
ncbi:7-carboxy-7-deazaguanine synthase QueE [Bacillus sp. ISL-35]|uniref:7-carboxy-7-deazaguanine synthase QueE n=1 Tax=Bacillus sp. ISL-35 TaxID=2819122 RepID=UPI001BE5E1A3|nr:7-carboxy-7-deazaguanine synthase QueE [Bacillus sp. ISL-35]MBT2680939.1 7-carboxy-7-deazaguanine synthase QueE [Bacillus sp. ISL-35]MBT2705256.1 7-carboxy-7-deazaguanine synthase QueE [Chryseobacterium sp. ISL-80]